MGDAKKKENLILIINLIHRKVKNPLNMNGAFVTNDVKWSLIIFLFDSLMV